MAESDAGAADGASLRPDEIAHQYSFRFLGLAWSFLQAYGWFMIGALVLYITLKPYVVTWYFNTKHSMAMQEGLKSARGNKAARDAARAAQIARVQEELRTKKDDQDFQDQLKADRRELIQQQKEDEKWKRRAARLRDTPFAGEQPMDASKPRWGADKRRPRGGGGG